MIQCLILSETDLELSMLLKMMLNSAPPASTSQVVGLQLCPTMHNLVGAGSQTCGLPQGRLVLHSVLRQLILYLIN